MSYRVVKPVVVVASNGDVVHHMRAGAVVEVDEVQAKKLVAAGKLALVKEPKPAEFKPEPKPAS